MNHRKDCPWSRCPSFPLRVRPGVTGASLKRVFLLSFFAEHRLLSVVSRKWSYIVWDFVQDRSDDNQVRFSPHFTLLSAFATSGVNYQLSTHWEPVVGCHHLLLFLPTRLQLKEGRRAEDSNALLNQKY